MRLITKKKICLFFMILRRDRMSLILITRLQICTFQIYVSHSKRARIASMMTMFCVGVICGVREHVFRENPITQLIKLCIRDKTKFAQIICIAHNARAFDAQFILKELAECTS